MGHIGDVDLKLKVAVLEVLDPDGVVEIAGGLAVDGHDVEAAEIAAAPDLLAADHGGQAFSFLDDLRGNPVGQVNLPDHDLDVDAETSRSSQHFNPAAART